MVEELEFRINNSRFVVKQNIPLDSLVEGVPIGKEYEIILYNPHVPIYNFPKLGFNSWICGGDSAGVVELVPEFPEKRPVAKTILEGVGATGGSGLGAIIGKGAEGAVAGAALGWLAAKIIPQICDYVSSIFEKHFGVKKVEVIKGSNLRMNSGGDINIDDALTLFFGVYHYTNRFTTPEDIEANREAAEQIKHEIQSQIGAVMTRLGDLFAKNKSWEFEEGDPYYEEYTALRRAEGFLNACLSVFGNQEGIIYLHNKIQIESDYRKAAEARRTRGHTNVGDICIQIGRGYKKSRECVKEEIKSALHGRDLFLENSLSIDLMEIARRKRDKDAKRYSKSGSGGERLKQTFQLPFSVQDKTKGTCIYGALDIDTQSLCITSGNYFDSAGRIVRPAGFA
jgi:hypothetical protein